jgi:4-diphosphocytidyl-2-C-methyl-D-erythritol kinase
MIREHAYAKVNLVLHVGPTAPNGLHEVCSLFASIDLADEIEVVERDSGPDRVVCPGVEGENLAARALELFREKVPGLPPLEVTIHKLIPVAAGLGGGSADAAAVLRAANELAGAPLGGDTLMALAARLGSDVPSQVDPGHAIVTGTGDRVEPVELAQLAVVLVPQREGLGSGEVFAELDRLGGGRAELDPEPLHDLNGAPPEQLAAAMENDLQPAALSLRPELEAVLERLREAGARGVQVSGSGPTCFGLFAEFGDAQLARSHIEGSQVAVVRA